MCEPSVARHLGTATGDGRARSFWVNEDNSMNNPAMQPTYFAVENAAHEPLTAPARNDTPLFVVIRGNVQSLDSPSRRVSSCTTRTRNFSCHR